MCGRIMSKQSYLLYYDIGRDRLFWVPLPSDTADNLTSFNEKASNNLNRPYAISSDPENHYSHANYSFACYNERQRDMLLKDNKELEFDFRNG